MAVSPGPELTDELVGADRVFAGRTDVVESPPLDVLAVSQSSAPALAREALGELLGHDPEQVPDLPRPVDALREWAEWRTVLQTVREAAADDLVLVDGSLHGGPLVPPSVARRVHE